MNLLPKLVRRKAEVDADGVEHYRATPKPAAAVHMRLLSPTTPLEGFEQPPPSWLPPRSTAPRPLLGVPTRCPCGKTVRTGYVHSCEAS